MDNIVLSLTVEEVNLIVGALGELPFKVVFPLVSNIDSQIVAQRQTAEAPSTGDTYTTN